MAITIVFITFLASLIGPPVVAWFRRWNYERKLRSGVHALGDMIIDSMLHSPRAILRSGQEEISIGTDYGLHITTIEQLPDTIELRYMPEGKLHIGVGLARSADDTELRFLQPDPGKEHWFTVPTDCKSTMAHLSVMVDIVDEEPECPVLWARWNVRSADDTTL